ncbi:MAG: FAD-dependent oxidoreductase [Gluconacetobacter diazotrophicus]|nr:FAD-dependent oxidoreductase [Gluconacetobacter diazotrophicus]
MPGRRRAARDVYSHDVIVIGAGAAGLTAAGGCAMFGLRVALVERGVMGGECLNAGCVPSKALIAAARRAAAMRDGERFGVRAGEVRVDWAGVRAHVAAAVARIAPRDGRERFEALGVEVVAGEARLLDAKRVRVGERVLRAPRIVIATGSRPHVPALPGIETVPVLTNDTVWELDVLPQHLVVMGGGSIGVELAQAFRRLGAAVTVVEHGRCLAREDPDAAALVLDALRRDGVRIREAAEVVRVGRGEGGDGIVIELAGGEQLAASHLLVAGGRDARVEHLDLEAAGVASGTNGIRVDRRRRTGNRRVFAVGDCREGPRFTHLAGEDGSVVVRNIALGWPARIDLSTLPRVLFADPELAQLGMTAAEARAAGGRVSVETRGFDGDDRAATEGREEGFVRVVRRGRRIAGVTIVGENAGEMLLPWSLVMRKRASTFVLADTVVAYPTRSERSKAAAFGMHEGLVFGRAARGWAALLARVRRR